jgi:hypothetical protein
MKRSFINALFCGAALFGFPLLNNAQEQENQSFKADIKINGTTIADVSFSKKITTGPAQADSAQKHTPPPHTEESTGAPETPAITGETTLSIKEKNADPTATLASFAKEDSRAKWESEVKRWTDPVSVTDDSDPTDNSNFAVGRNLVIRKTSYHQVLCIGGSAAVLKEVFGDIVVIGGDAILLAPVTGRIVVIGGDAKIDAKIQGEIVALGGTVIKGSNAQVSSEKSVPFAEALSKISGAGLFTSLFFSKFVLTWRFTLLIWNACISLLLISLFGDAIQRADTILRDRRGASFITGFVWTPIYWLLLIGAIALCFVFVGIPILFFLLILNFALETFGLAVVGLQFGRWLLNRFNQINPSDHLAVFTGICALGIFRIIPVFGFVGWWIVCWFGVGAALINLFSHKQQASGEDYPKSPTLSALEKPERATPVIKEQLPPK